MKILLIEDNDVDARACKRMLAEHREEKFSVSRARTMSEGLNLINDVRPAVILADLGLPDSRGSESVDRLVKSQFFGPIIVLTGQVSEEHALEALASGVADYLVKGQITADSVRRSIRYCLERWSSANQIRLQAELLNRTNEAVVVAKPDGLITYRNKGANNLLAKIADHSPQGNLFELLGYSESRIRELLESITERDTVEFEDSIIGNENSTLSIKSRWNLSQSPEPHNALELIIVLSDITRQREISRRVQEKQKLECLGVLAGGIAHDFNNILAAMMLSVEDILLGGQLSACVEADLKVIKSSIERAASLCSQLLAYAGQHGGQVQRIQINDQINEVYRIMRTSLGTSFQFETTLDPDLPPIAANAGQINQIIMNLLLNAAEALEGKSGTISVTTRRKICQTNESDGFILNASTGDSKFILIQIQDSGMGMDKEILERVFDPFYSTKATGRGLGLAAVHGIVRSQKGMIQVKSDLDSGTCFRIYLPITDDLPKNCDTHSSRLNSTTPKPPGRVLLVDDEEIVRTGTRMLLERLGYLVICAEDGVEAVTQFERQAKDTQAVLLDITMPGSDGFQVFKEIRNINPTVPIILMSGYAEESATNELLEIGNPKFLQKPFTADALRQTIEAAIR